MTAKFGKTWWGNEWLNALANIDYTSRIPRGMRYARWGLVKELKFSKGTFNARVQGTRDTPYKIRLGIPQFEQATIDRLVDSIVTHPMLVSKLLNRKLDPEIVNICRQHDIRLFPTSWNDLSMYCSCPDWAVPCKHLAAVIYQISLEIDNNPFLVFQMHGVDLIAELDKRNIKIQAEKIMEPLDITALLQPEKIKTTLNVIKELPAPDFSTIANLLHSLISLLPDVQSFCSLDFKAVYLAQMTQIARKATRLLKSRLKTEYDEIEDLSKGIQVSTDNVLLVDNLPYALIAISPEQTASAHAEVELLRLFAYCALYLLKNGAVIPQILHSEKGYVVRWLPAILNPEIRQLTSMLYAAVPQGIVNCYIGPEKRVPLQPGEWILSSFIGFFIRNFKKAGYDEFCEWFFDGSQYAFEKIGEKETPGAVKAYTDRFHIDTVEYQPAILIEECEDEESFLLSLEMWKGSVRIAMTSFLQLKKYDSIRFAALRSISLISEIFPPVDAYIDAKGEKPIRLTLKNFTDFLFTTIPIIKLLQIKVFLPKSLEEILKPKASLRIKRAQVAGKSKGFLRLEQLLQFDWIVSVAGEEITETEFRKLVQKSGELVKFRQHYIFVNPEDLSKISKYLSQDVNLSPSAILRYALSGEYEREPIAITNEVKALIKELTENQTVPIPKEIKAELRPYQARGFSWMYRNTQLGFGSIIADDMGLGKTLQVLTLLQKLKNDGRFLSERILIIVPTGLIHNWIDEIEHFSPDLTVFIYHGSQRDIKDFNQDILLTSYGIARSDVAILKKMSWAITVIDEAQNIKNPATSQSKAVKSIPSPMRIAMSGTPVENRLSEYWSIMDFTNPGYLGKLQDFNREYAQPIQISGDEVIAKKFRKITAPFMTRRLKSDKNIISDLPDKIERNEPTMLMPAQAALYEKTVGEAMKVIEEIEEDNQKALFKKSGLILQMILALKQICNHPAQFLKNGEWQPELSGKAIVLLDIVESIVESGEKVLVFTQFKEMGDILQQMVAQRLGRKPLFLHGGCTLEQRRKMVAQFRADRTCQVFILSIKAAGVGLNLTEASNVIHYDLWWNPAVEAQATDRTYRIGQHKNVIVRRFITQGTFEEKIDKMIQSKKHLSEMTVASGENWIGNLSNRELHEIFDPSFTNLG